MIIFIIITYFGPFNWKSAHEKKTFHLFSL